MRAWASAGDGHICAATHTARSGPRISRMGPAIEADGSEALYEVAVPAALYQGVVRADLGDVRVFNGAGEVVPHAWRPRHTAIAEAQTMQKLTLFPLRGQPGANIDSLALRVQRGAGGAVSVNVDRAAPYQCAPAHVVRLSRRQHAPEPRCVRLNSIGAGAGGFSGRLRVDGSDDLGAWHTLVAAAPVLSLEVGGQRLEQKRIELPQQKLKYLRLSWVGDSTGTSAPELTAARGELADRIVDVPRERGCHSRARRGRSRANTCSDLRPLPGRPGRFRAARTEHDRSQG